MITLIKPEVNPVIHLSRKVPIALRDKLENELERMESLEVNIKVTELTDWLTQSQLLKNNAQLLCEYA